MAWSIVALGTNTVAASGDITLDEPTGTAQGDLIVACIGYRSTPAFTLPTGWSLVATQQSSGNTDATQGIASGVMAYIVRGVSAPSFLFTRTAGDVAMGRTVTYRGNSSVPYDTGGAATLGTIGEPSLAAITTALNNELIVAMISHGDNSLTVTMDAVTNPSTASGATDTTTAPTSNTWIERSDTGSNTGADIGLFIADGLMTTAGSTGTFSADAVTTTRSVMIVGAFRIAATAAITGTISPTVLETDIVTGGKTLIITLTDDKWVASGGTFDGQRDEIIAGVDSAQSEAFGWDAVPKALQNVTGVVRTSDTVVTITWDAFATYDITATETITTTVPGTALIGTAAVVASSTFTVTPTISAILKDIIGGGGIIPWAR